MKKTCLLIIMFIGTFNSISYAQSGTIIINIIGIENIGGQIFIGLYNSNEGFPDKGKEFFGAFVKANSETLHHTFTKIPNGDYAIAIFHDSNNNGRHDKNFFGIPKEGYAFSNNPAATFGAPSYDKAKFILNTSYTAEFKMKY